MPHPLVWDQFVLGKSVSVTIWDRRGTGDKDPKTRYEDESLYECCNVNIFKGMLLHITQTLKTCAVFMTFKLLNVLSYHETYPKPVAGFLALL